MTKFRNVCAHGERLYSYQTRNDIPDTALHHKLGIPKNGTQYSMGKHDLFAIVIASVTCCQMTISYNLKLALQAYFVII